jgi:hypothetical protein
MAKIFSDQIFEATVTEVDFSEGTCTVSPLSVNTGSSIGEIPLPHLAGNGNSGMFYGIRKGTRVICLHTSARGRETTVIVGTVPKKNQYRKFFNRRKGVDTPAGIGPYPEMKEGRFVIKGDSGANLSLMENGDVFVRTVGGGGSYLKKNDGRSAHTLVSEDIIRYSSGSKSFSGPVRRLTGDQRNQFQSPDLNEVPLFADPRYPIIAQSKGFFLGSNPQLCSLLFRKRNPEISEHRTVMNEFSTDSMFTGFDDEVDRYSNNISLFDNAETFARSRQPGNTLYLAEHELIEVIGGNVVDINGNVLDINYGTLSYGGGEDRVPKNNIPVNYDRARRISRRGIGYHFQLSTNTRSDDESSSNSGFVFDIDKEGMLKVNIPASSNTGNIPFASKGLFTGINDGVDVTYLNPSSVENVPVTLRGAFGEIVYPDKEGSQDILVRNTGTRYELDIDNPYFPSGNSSAPAQLVRVNSTKYHNMYAAAERLIANTIKVINIPDIFTDEEGKPEGLSVGQPFEVVVPESLTVAENILDAAGFQEFLPARKRDFPTFMSVVAVAPGEPAINPGGDTLVAGKKYDNDADEVGAPFSNTFNSSLVGDEIEADSVNNSKKVGGKSAHLNVEGSIEASIGKDNFDEKSIMLDTAGSIVAWIGRDRNNRSLVMQTDGDVLFNIGGTYLGEQNPDLPVMTTGRFELRVNVTNKGFVSTNFSGTNPDVSKNPRAESDYIISISEAGLVIAGSRAGAGMVLRNDGPILIESSSSTVTMKGMEVKTVEAGRRAKSRRAGR